jgi:(1->4)-alpha-D-glucan 1-alpha-D-glucosylmutase
LSSESEPVTTGKSFEVRPSATYRVQLQPAFAFSDAAGLAGFLAALGVSHMYCSPYLQAVRGSAHGYDIVDFRRLNQELGGEPGYRQLIAALELNGLGQVVDIVPNHMAVGGRANHWWWDVLGNGPSSRYAKYFDIDWQGPDETGRETVLAPVLEDHYGRVVDAGELRIEWRDGSFVVLYHDYELPVSPRTFDAILEPAGRASESRDLNDLARAFAGLPHASRADWASSIERHSRKEILLERLRLVCEADSPSAEAIEAELNALNRDPDRLDGLLVRQNYRLAFWRTAAEELDYRRFFNIETLVGLRQELEEVFSETHRVWLGLVSEGSVQGLRVDHVDGLRDPFQYLNRLRIGSGHAYTVVEKILGPSEDLSEDWPVAGTTGYDFLNRVNNLFVDSDMEAEISRCYRVFAGEERDYGDVVASAKHQVLTEELASEVAHLSQLLLKVCGAHRRHRDRTRREVRDAVEEMLVAFPVYRSYARPDRHSTATDRATVLAAARTATERRPEMDPELLSFLGQLLLLEYDGPDEIEFALRFAQVSAAVTAKGVEDTAFYRYNRLISLNEVGGTPDVFGRSPGQFHADTARVAAKWPETMLTLSTHDTKRSGDVRARINLLSELAEAWGACVERLAEISGKYRSEPWPDRNTEYLFYQTVLGAWPISTGRVAIFMNKAIREAKVHTSWVDPAPEYELAVAHFLRGAMGDRRFAEELERFLTVHRIVELGRVSSLAQTTLLLTCPGVADIYQGTELWDLSLVDPDNRRPVDYSLRNRLLGTLSRATPPVAIADDGPGRWKLWLMWRLLADRQARPDLYRTSGYEPLEVNGPGADHVVAYVRGDLAVLIPRLIVGVDGGWGKTRVTLGQGSWTNLLGGAEVSGGPTRVSELLCACPVAVLRRGHP